MTTNRTIRDIQDDSFTTIRNESEGHYWSKSVSVSGKAAKPGGLGKTRMTVLTHYNRDGEMGSQSHRVYLDKSEALATAAALLRAAGFHKQAKELREKALDLMPESN